MDLRRPEDCCAAAMNEVDLEGHTALFNHFCTRERGVFLVTSYQCKTCSQKWERFVETQEPDELRWDAVF